MLDLDHVAHFVPEVEPASRALEALGFTLTPFSPQSHRLQPDGPLVPAGTGNRCVMFESGYLEFLTPTGDTPVADQLRAAIARYVGVHLIAFGTDDAAGDYARLARERFNPGAPVALQRPISTPSGEGIARFTVVRVPPGTMAEGRIQYCQHHTRELVWQDRWMHHRNGAVALSGVMLCVGDPAEAAARYARYTGLPVTARGDSRLLATHRGTLAFLDTAAVERTLGAVAPPLPWIAGYTLVTRDPAAARRCASEAAVGARVLDAQRVAVALPAALGGYVVFEPEGAAAGFPLC
ncbi:MAG TPA: VOC family protein [Burkholderiales bacterium]|nr:VOC family protein [Burkholderiales bacterium]